MNKDAFLKEIDAFIKAHGWTARKFGLLAMNDTKFVKRLNDGGDIRLGTMERVRQFMEAHKAHAE